MAKSQDAFRTISEVSDWLDTPAHVLRFWESKFTQIKPVKRAGGRRYYRPDDMALLSGIKILLHEQGMTIKGVQKLLREQGVRHVIEIGVTPDTGEPQLDGDWIEAERSFDVDALPEVMSDGADPIGNDLPDRNEDATTAVPVDVPPDANGSWPVSSLSGVSLVEHSDATDTEDAFDSARTGAAQTDDLAADVTSQSETPSDDAAPAADPPAPAEPMLPPREVSLPFVRARAEAAEPHSPSPQAEILAFAPRARPPIPTIPDERGYTARPGAITALTGGDRTAVKAAIKANASRIRPLVARLKVVADRIANPRD